MKHDVTALKEAIKQAEKIQNMAIFAVQCINDYLPFRFFAKNDLPTVTINGCGEIVLVWRCFALDVKEILEIIENKGYITPKDFTKEEAECGHVSYV